jgi:hypothetical protein
MINFDKSLSKKAIMIFLTRIILEMMKIHAVLIHDFKFVLR